MVVSHDDIKEQLSNLTSAEFAGRLGAVGRVLKIAEEDGQLGVVLEFNSAVEKSRVGQWRALAEEFLLTLDGISSASVVATRIPGSKHQNSEASNATKREAPPAMPQRKAPPQPTPIPGIKHIIAIASGKGGVGKSTTTVNLAYALKDLGLRVGIVDCDVFGPSIPHLLGSEKRPTTEEGKLLPIIIDTIQTMSVGYLLDVDQAVVWRGPRVMGATRQMLKDVAWEDLDVLIVDLPPGTGDVQLTMVQQVVLSGAIIVSTPQDLALIDARKGITMFEKTRTPVLGIIENMSTYCCPNCGYESAIFGEGGARKTAEQLGIPFLGALPLTLSVREHADAGKPLLRERGKSEEAKAYHAIAQQLKRVLFTD